MPRRSPINPVGYYHVSSRGCYGRALFANDLQHERFLMMYGRIAPKYGWTTLAWALMKNHHHFVVQLSSGGLSEGMRELHGGFSRWIHELYGQTGQGHLFRHAFFSRELETDSQVLVACTYVDLNATAAVPSMAPETARWCGYRATIGLEHPRPFHAPSALLELLASRPAAARRSYRQLVQDRLVLRGHGSSPNDGVPPRG